MRDRMVAGSTGAVRKPGRAEHLPNSWRRAELMGMAASIDFYTADMVRAIPGDGNWYETVHGELLVSPGPRGWHQEMVARLFVALRNYLESERVGHAFSSPADISWGPDILVQPDVFVVSLEQARTMDWSRMQDLRLTIEVLSPGSTRADRFTKRRLYQEVGVPLYWLIDGDACSVEIWRPANRFPEVEREQIRWMPDCALEPFEVKLADLFRPL